MQRQVCPDCGTVFHRPPDLRYVDHSRGQWIAAFPWEKPPRLRSLEKHGLILFEKTCGAEDRRKLSARITFGWESLREKLLLAELGLDEVTLELCKLDLARTLPDGRLAEGTELRLLQVEGTRW